MLKKFIRVLLSLQLVVLSFPPDSRADDLTSGFARAEDLQGATPGNTYVSGQQAGGVLIKVNLWGAVNKSGIHFVPYQTDFVSLLSYAGGPRGNADLSEAYIKRKTKDTEEIIPVNIKDIVGAHNAHNPSLEPNDIVVIPEIEPTVSNNTVLTVGFVSSLLSVILASIVLKDQINDD